MKIGISSYSYNNYMKATGADVFAVAEIAKQQGYDGIEFLALEKRPQDENVMDTARALRAHCEALGIDICAYTVDANLFREEDPAAEIARLKACVDVCHALGAPLMRHDVAWGLRPGMRSWHDAVAAVVPAIREITEYAAAFGIRTCTENHGFMLQDSDRVEALILAVNHPNFGWLVDMGNFACADEDSAHAVGIAAPYAFHVHAKDFLIKSGSLPNPGKGWFCSRGGNYIRGTIAGHGVIPVRQCVQILKKAGYDGWLSLEFEGLEDNLTATELGLAFLREVTA